MVQGRKGKKGKEKGKKGKGKGKGKGAKRGRDRLSGAVDAVEDARRAKRAGRFGDGAAEGAKAAPGRKGNASKGLSDPFTGFNSSGVVRSRLAAQKMAAAAAEQGHAGEIDWDSFAIKGTSTQLEKSYFRLTSAPVPASVRPQPVLEAALARVSLRVARQVENYFYAQDQLKAIRQDLTVQHLRNPFTVKVYETHARMALGYGELADYNQCQAQLIALYKQVRANTAGGGPKRSARSPADPAAADSCSPPPPHPQGLPGHEAEFQAYRILYQTFQGTAGDGEMLRTLKDVAGRQGFADPAIAHAMQVRAAVQANDYLRFFRLLDGAPNLGGKLMGTYVERVRFAALQCLCRSYAPSVAVAVAAQALGFEGEGEGEGASGRCGSWLRKHGAVLSAAGDTLDTKASKGRLFVPKDEGKVAHGDANLAIDDFLARATA